MPIPTQNRNAILSQLDAAFTALEAGNTQALAEMIHQAFEFATGGRTYNVQVHGDAGILIVRIKRKPV